MAFCFRVPNSRSILPFCHGCPGSPLVTQSGLKPIENIAEGELVASRDEETGEIAWKPVTALFVFDDDRITYLLTLVDGEGREQSFEVTDNHPFYVEGEGWVDSIDLKPGMRVPRYEGGFLTVVSITSLNRSPVTYNFEVEGFHTYFVGEQGAWVHNACSCGGGPIKPFEVTTFDEFRKRSVMGDNLEGHELLQHSNLKARELATTRHSTDASKNNPVIALEKSVHKDINKAQRSIDARSQSGAENIADNARILREHPDIPNEAVDKLEKMAIRHNEELGR